MVTRRLTKRRKTVIVHLKAGDKGSIEGILLGRTGKDYVLTGAHYLQDKETPIPLDGETRVERKNVLFFQVVG